MRLPLIGILLLLAPGCLDTVDLEPLPTESEPRLGLGALDHVKIGPGGDAETAVHVSRDGKTVLACSHGGFTQPSPLWASVDGGDSFRRIDPQPNPIVSGDCDLTITANGDWFIVYDTIASATVAASSDQGRTWRFHYVAAPPFGGVDRPWIQAVGNILYLTYADVMSAEPFIATFTKSTDGGRTWSPPVKMATFADTPNYTNCFLGHLVVRNEGRSIRSPIDCYQPSALSRRAMFLVSSEDGGLTFTTRALRGPDATSIRVPSMSYAGADNLWLVHSLGTQTRDVFVSRSRDDGKTWGQPILVARATQMPIGWAWVDGRPDGSATIAWMNTSRPANATDTQAHWQVHAARVSAEGVLESEGPVGALARGPAIYEFLMVSHDAEGRAFIVYPMPGEGCSQPPPVTVTQNRNRQCIHLLREEPALAP